MVCTWVVCWNLTWLLQFKIYPLCHIFGTTFWELLIWKTYLYLTFKVPLKLCSHYIRIWYAASEPQVCQLYSQPLLMPVPGMKAILTPTLPTYTSALGYPPPWWNGCIHFLPACIMLYGILGYYETSRHMPAILKLTAFSDFFRASNCPELDLIFFIKLILKIARTKQIENKANCF